MADSTELEKSETPATDTQPVEDPSGDAAADIETNKEVDHHADEGDEGDAANAEVNDSTTVTGVGTVIDTATGKRTERIQLSLARPLGFYERTAYERFATGTEVIVVTALGNAISLAIQLADVLEEKQYCKKSKVMTSFEGGEHPRGPRHPTAGITIHLERNPTFKGSKIPQGMVGFHKPEGEAKFTPIYDDKPMQTFASVNAGDYELFVGGSALNAAFKTTLEAAEQNIDRYAPLHKSLVEKALKENPNATKGEDIRLVEAVNLSEHHPDLHASFCRICFDLKDKGPEGCKAVGAVFLDIFREDKRPKGAKKNIGMIYVVGPKGKDFGSKEEFLGAVSKTANNLMTALVDYNGLVKRTRRDNRDLDRLDVARIALFSGGVYKHEDATKMEVAEKIIEGITTGYRYRLAPRVTFAFDDNVFQEAWKQMTGAPDKPTTTTTTTTDEAAAKAPDAPQPDKQADEATAGKPEEAAAEPEAPEASQDDTTKEQQQDDTAAEKPTEESKDAPHTDTNGKDETAAASGKVDEAQEAETDETTGKEEAKEDDKEESSGKEEMNGVVGGAPTENGQE
ncbi:unnamed protein product [Vitrella brassicaformis CCMP3155]|uniref:DNA/RNA-binding protein Alba-like domain-containing protein n=1 Tax=Vitrella brassicaformis (strain CCMP3155) TaxID=1169540 RepID=A0A0G4EI70_VITBC|nr:unnamed protein product [Vitrella brassicaformis CCMP3155]|mmetsp:Transcript_26874/g.77160  ORF Transcript_26874/g.77160 Transcript_26874/m.77160 type:complete len:569 (+) Transcript_26874:131-1837(+)|eukprot:CEL95698.1 unnamed protein product [Vitrella brassicaformis CCMP3155]